MKGKQLLLTLLCLGVLGTVSGCYFDPPPSRPSSYGRIEPDRGGYERRSEEEREYRRQRRQERAQERAYQQGDWEHDRDTRPDWQR
jgi:hypothetical protein